jgi:rubrerythrin
MSENNNPSIEMLSIALGMEEKGKAFYEKAMCDCHDEHGKEIFEFLRNEEIVHVGRIKKIYASLKEGQGWNENWKEVKARPRDLESFFRDLKEKAHDHVKADSSYIKALEFGIDFENKAVEFYENELKRSAAKLERDFIEMMVLEEKKHAEILEDMKQYMEDPEGWNSKFNPLNYAGG